MTRKDYILIAASLAATKPAMISPELNAWTNTVHGVASALARDNSKFDSSRFLKAAGAK